MSRITLRTTQFGEAPGRPTKSMGPLRVLVASVVAAAIVAGLIGCSQSDVGSTATAPEPQAHTLSARDFAAGSSSGREESGLEITTLAAMNAGAKRDALKSSPNGPGARAGESTNQAKSEPAKLDVMNIGGVRGAVLPNQSTRPDQRPDPLKTQGSDSTITTRVGDAPAMQPAASASSQLVLIETLVGQINGKPVFATEILDPLDGSLRAAGQQARDISQWKRKAAELIVGELRRRIEDELILAEARRGLTPEQRQGLFRFLEVVQAELVAGQRGSSVAADEQLQQTTGRTLRQEAQDQLDRQLIRTEVQRRIEPKVVVSWRDVQNEYDRQSDKFNPPAEYLFRVIYLNSENAQSVANVTSQLASGKLFAEVAASEYNEFNRKEGGSAPRTHSGSQSEGEFTPTPELNEAMQRVSVGQVLGPISYAPDKKQPSVQRTAWVYLERIDQQKGISLYDAQLQLETQLRNERRGSEFQRYFERLYKRGNVSKIEVMGDKLMSIATDRYLPASKRGK